MKLLVFSAYYTPEIVASMYLVEDILQAFVNGSSEVVLYVPTPTRGISKQIRKEYTKKRTEYQHNGRLKIRRLPLFGENKNSFLRFIRYVVLETEFFFAGLTADADLIFIQSTPPIQGITGAFLKKIKKVPFVYNLQDIFPDGMVSSGMTKKGSLLWKIGRKVEDFTYKNADKIIVISEGFKRNIMAKGVPEEKIGIIPNWVDENAVTHIGRAANPLFDRYGLDRNKFYVTYCGNIGLSQNMDMLLDVAGDLRDCPEICFVIVGDGAYKSRVEERIRNENIGNVVLLPFQPYSDISCVFSLGDAGLIISKSGIGVSSVPSKTWSIMSASQPVLASFDTDSMLAEIVRQSHCGVCVEPDKAQLLRDAVLRLYGDKRENLAAMGENGRRYILDHLSSEAGKRKWREVVEAFRR